MIRAAAAEIFFLLLGQPLAAPEVEPPGVLVFAPGAVVAPVAGLFCPVLGDELTATPRVVASCAKAAPDRRRADDSDKVRMEIRFMFVLSLYV